VTAVRTNVGARKASRGDGLVAAETGARRRAGSRRHRAIGRQTDLVRAAGALQLVLLLTVGFALALLVVLVLQGLG
jgi:hypothetical protein